MNKYLSFLLLASIAFVSSSVSASSIQPIDNVLDDFLWFDQDADIREGSLTQQNTVTENGKTTYYNLYGEAVMQRQDNTLSVNLDTDENGNVIRFAKANLSEGSDGEFISALEQYEIGPDGNPRILFSYTADTQTNYQYDDNGNLLSEVSVKASGEVYSITYEYDENGNQLSRSERREYANGGSYTFNTSKNSNGNVVSQETIHTNSDGSIRSLRTYEAEYDANGKLTSSRRFEESIWRYEDFEFSIEYDENGNPTSRITTEKDRSGNVIKTKSQDQTYDENGNLTAYVDIRRNSSGTITSYTTTESEYDENGNQLTSLWQRRNPDGTVNLTTDITYEYNENGVQTSKTSFQKNASGTMTYSQNTAFDESGNQTTQTTSYFDSNGNVRSGESVSSNYDENGNRISTTTINTDANGNTTSSLISTRQYDETGIPIEGLYQRFDAEGNITRSTEDSYEIVDGTRYYTSVSKDGDGNITYQNSGYTVGYNKESHLDTSYSVESEIEISSNGEREVFTLYSSGIGNSYKWGSANFDGDGNLSYFSGGNVEFKTVEEDGSYTQNTVESRYTNASEDLILDDTALVKSVESNIEAINSESFSSTGEYEGYTQTILAFDTEGNLSESTSRTYEGTQGNETYTGQKTISGRTYNEAGQQTGYTEVTYNTNDEVISRKVVTNIQYDGFGRKTSQNYQLFDSSNVLIDSGTE